MGYLEEARKRLKIGLDTIEKDKLDYSDYKREYNETPDVVKELIDTHWNMHIMNCDKTLGLSILLLSRSAGNLEGRFSGQLAKKFREFENQLPEIDTLKDIIYGENTKEKFEAYNQHHQNVVQAYETLLALIPEK